MASMKAIKYLLSLEKYEDVTKERRNKFISKDLSTSPLQRIEFYVPMVSHGRARLEIEIHLSAQRKVARSSTYDTPNMPDCRCHWCHHIDLSTISSLSVSPPKHSRDCLNSSRPSVHFHFLFPANRQAQSDNREHDADNPSKRNIAPISCEEEKTSMIVRQAKSAAYFSSMLFPSIRFTTSFTSEPWSKAHIIRKHS